MTRRSTVKRQAAPTVPNNSSPPKKATPEKSRKTRSTKSSEKENVSRNLSVADELLNAQNFQDESEAITISAIENYFMQGKTAAERMNTKARRGKKAQQNIPDYEEDEVQSSLTDDFTKCNLNDLRDYIQNKNSSAKHEKFIENLDEKEFSKWALYLASGFNILLHGVGSKREILTRFAESDIKGTTQMRVDARNEGTTPKALLTAINQHMKLQCNGRGMAVVEWARTISRQLKKQDKQIILLIDNIESQDWRCQQEVICALLENRNVVKMIATVDHIYSSFIWNSRQLSTLNFIHTTVNSFDMPLQELITGESRLLGLDAKSSQSSHTLHSLDVFWKSLAQNSQKLFQLFFKMYFESKKPVNFWSLFNAAKDDFIVSIDTSLRTQLVEFKDHGILRWTRSDDGNDQLAGIVEQKLIFEFLASKGMGLDEENE